MGSGVGKSAEPTNISAYPRAQSSARPPSRGRPPSANQSRQQRSNTPNSNSSSNNSTLSLLSLQDDIDPQIMVCERCSANFTIFKRKFRCLDCSKMFCSNCIHKEPRKCCRTCFMFTGTKNRSQLMQIKVKDLRQYLAARDIPTMACREKEELVDLVIQYLRAHGASIRVTVNNVDVSSPSSYSYRSSSNSSSARPPGVGRTPPPSGAATIEVTNTPQNEPRVDIHGEMELGTSRTAWPEPSINIEADQIPVESFSEEESNPETVNQEQPQQPPVRHRASISDLNAVDEIDSLTVRQLKEILTVNFINYKGCVERWELEERVKRLYNEKEDYKSQEQGSSLQNTALDTTTATTTTTTSQDNDHYVDNTCKICMDSPIDCVLLECGHMVTCTKCGKQLAECPMCRQYIIRAVHVFRS